MNVDGPGLAVRRVAPDRLQEGLPREHPSGSRRERAQELELDVRELDGLAANRHQALRRIDTEVARIDRFGLARLEPRGGGAPEQRAHATSELPDRERLRDVVVGAELESEHLVELV